MPPPCIKPETAVTVISLVAAPAFLTELSGQRHQTENISLRQDQDDMLGAQLRAALAQVGQIERWRIIYQHTCINFHVTRASPAQNESEPCSLGQFRTQDERATDHFAAGFVAMTNAGNGVMVFFCNPCLASVARRARRLWVCHVRGTCSRPSATGHARGTAGPGGSAGVRQGTRLWVIG